MSDTDQISKRPAGNYAVVEILGHQTLVGRVEDVERFGTSMLKIEPIYRGQLLGPVFQGGASIDRFSPCTAEQAYERSPEYSYHLPSAVRALLPDDLQDKPEALPAPRSIEEYEAIEDDDLSDLDEFPV